MTNNSRRLEALRYAYDMCGSSPCEDCNHYRHITSDEERQNFIECSSNLGCVDAKEYYKAHDNYIKEYLENPIQQEVEHNRCYEQAAIDAIEYALDNLI